MEKNEQVEFYNKMWLNVSSVTGLAPILRRRQISYFIRKYTSGSRLTLLDLGCGRGHLSEALSKFGSVTGVDFATKTIEHNKQRFPHITFVSGDVTDPTLPERLDYYDVVVSSEVIEHIDIATRPQFLKNVRTVLKRDGLFILTTPYKDSIMRLKQPDENETEFFSRFEGQPVSNIMAKQEIITAMKPYFKVIDFASVQPCIKNKLLDYSWKGLFWPINYRLVNKLTRSLDIDGKYMVVAGQKLAKNG